MQCYNGIILHLPVSLNSLSLTHCGSANFIPVKQIINYLLVVLTFTY